MIVALRTSSRRSGCPDPVCPTVISLAEVRTLEGLMIERTFAISLTLLAALGAVNVLPACGDKFLISSRGTRYQRAPAARVPAAILIYTNPASEAGKVLAGI